METNWAGEHIQVIRTLMERSAVYRRALAPIMTWNGAVGSVGAVLGWIFKVSSPIAFILYWACFAALAMAGSFLLVRRQALRASEPFWSPPTRRVTQAFLPPLAAGTILGIFICVKSSEPPLIGPAFTLRWLFPFLPLAWVVLYGCAFHAAGFFMPRGMRLFGWAFVLGGCVGLLLANQQWSDHVEYGHAIMGVFFGALHLAYGIYLYFTEQRRNET
jgi:hypothetical protein